MGAFFFFVQVGVYAAIRLVMTLQKRLEGKCK